MFNSLIFLRLNFELSIFFCNFVVLEVDRDPAGGWVPRARPVGITCPKKIRLSPVSGY